MNKSEISLTRAAERRKEKGNERRSRTVFSREFRSCDKKGKNDWRCHIMNSDTLFSTLCCCFAPGKGRGRGVNTFCCRISQRARSKRIRQKPSKTRRGQRKAETEAEGRRTTRVTTIDSMIQANWQKEWRINCRIDCSNVVENRREGQINRLSVPPSKKMGLTFLDFNCHWFIFFFFPFPRYRHIGSRIAFYFQWWNYKYRPGNERESVGMFLTRIANEVHDTPLRDSSLVPAIAETTKFLPSFPFHSFSSRLSVKNIFLTQGCKETNIANRSSPFLTRARRALVNKASRVPMARAKSVLLHFFSSRLFPL